MKDAGIFLGSYAGGSITWDHIGSFSFLDWYQACLVGCFVLLISIFGGITGGFIGSFSENKFIKLWNKWNGKENGMKKYL